MRTMNLKNKVIVYDDEAVVVVAVVVVAAAAAAAADWISFASTEKLTLNPL